MNILVTIDRNYLPHFAAMLYSLLASNPTGRFSVYVMNSTLTEDDLAYARRIIGNRGEIHLVRVAEDGLADAPTTDRYPREMYYRIFAAEYLPRELDRVLYLDPDMIINGSLGELYDMQMGTAFFAAASHIGSLLNFFNELRLDMDEESPYINSGVMLMDLQRLREEQDTDDVFDYIESHRGKLLLPDQDIISGLYGDRIIPLDPYRYNMTERLYMLHRQSGGRMDLDYVRRTAAVIHYCGRNKPWRQNYIGRLDVFYRKTVAALARDFPEDTDEIRA